MNTKLKKQLGIASVITFLTVAGLSLYSRLGPGCSIDALRMPTKAQGSESMLLYREEPVRIVNDSGIQLAGTLTEPATQRIIAGVVLIGGSGPNDRDESDGVHRPFAVMAHYLADHGVAVLRYDKRGAGMSSGDFETATIHDFAADAGAALRYLAMRPELMNVPCGTIGHSEGALVAEIVASGKESDLVRFSILMAPLGVGGEKFSIAQIAALAKSFSCTPSSMKVLTNYVHNVYTILKANPETATLRDKISKETELAFSMAGGPGGNSTNLDLLGQREVDFFSSAWMRDFMDMDPCRELKSIHCPLLILQGDKDTQVPIADNLDILRQSVQQDNKTNCAIVVLPNHNHCFQVCKTGSVLEYTQIDQAISQQTLDQLAQWICQITPSLRSQALTYKTQTTAAAVVR